MERTAFRHVLPLTVQWGDMDALGHVNNAIYFRYLESGRLAYFDTLLGHGSLGGAEGPILADIRCTYLGQLRHPAEIDVCTRTSRLGGKSMSIEAALFHRGNDTPVATSTAVVVWFDYVQQQTIAVPDRLRERVRDYEVTPVA